jgi:hypothetical protein
MIIMFGIRRLRKAMGPILLRCANCGMSRQALFRISTWFALFFIPLIPISFKHYTACPNCKRFQEVSKAEVEQARTREESFSPAGATPETVAAPATLESTVNAWAAGEPGPAGAAGWGDPAVAAYQPPQPAAGWFPDPAGSGGLRYWDGQQWTAHTAPAQ